LSPDVPASRVEVMRILIGCLAFAFVFFSAAKSSEALTLINLPPPDSVAADKLAQIHSVGVINTLEPSLTLKEIGTTAFTNGVSTLSIDDWRLDDVIFQVVGEALSPRYSVEKIEDELDKFRAAEGRAFYPVEEQIGALVLNLPRRSVDAYLLFKSFDSYRDPIGGTNQSMRGLGIYHHDFLGHETNAEYVFIVLYVIDARTGKILASGTPCFPQQSGQCVHRTTQLTDQTKWAETADTLTDGQKAALRKDFTSFLTDGLRSELANMGFSATNLPSTSSQ